MFANQLYNNNHISSNSMFSITEYNISCFCWKTKMNSNFIEVWPPITNEFVFLLFSLCIYTTQEYNLRDVKDRQFLLSLYKKANKQGLDIGKYNTLKKQIADLEYDLRRLHDPLYLRMSPNATNSYTNAGLHAKHFIKTKSAVDTISELKNLGSTPPAKSKPFAGLSQIFEAATKKLKKWIQVRVETTISSAHPLTSCS